VIRRLSSLLRLAPALALAACAASSAPTPSPPRTPPSAAPPVPPAPQPATAATAPPPTAVLASEAEVAPPPFVPRVPELARFHAALWGLETKSRTDHVRVVWLGDSHGQADFWSGRLRSLLQRRFGDGGPGYVALGYKNYRHDRALLEVHGKWRMRPKQPASARREGDGVFGLAGLLMGGYADGPRVRVTLKGAEARRVTYDVCVKPHAPEDGIAVEAPGASRVTFVPSEAAPVDAIAHVVVRGDASGPLLVENTAGSPNLCGAVIEVDPAEGPGVVLDQLGFNGARYGTPLAWDEEAWAAELARRSPDLVVLEYGTNEAGDASPAYAKVGDQLEQLVARIRRVKPEVDCLVVSPTDRADAEDRIPPMHASVKQAAARAGCFFFDAYATMGGKGAMAARREEPRPRAQKDGIHMTIRGYEEMADAMHEALLAGYEGPTGTPIARATPSR
jgi:lysophospholipase L1-like esterase